MSLLVRLIVSTLVYGLCCFSVNAGSTQIWLAGVDPVAGGFAGTHAMSDYPDLFG
jgi:hypothetical protein